ncbi:MAG: hypothetical protein AB1589_36325 [Cyanobacteriota bacterium]
MRFFKRGTLLTIGQMFVPVEANPSVVANPCIPIFWLVRHTQENLKNRADMSGIDETR